MPQMISLCSFLAIKAISSAMQAQGSEDDCRPVTVPKPPHGWIWHHLAMSSNWVMFSDMWLYVVHLKNGDCA